MKSQGCDKMEINIQQLRQESAQDRTKKLIVQWAFLALTIVPVFMIFGFKYLIVWMLVLRHLNFVWKSNGLFTYARLFQNILLFTGLSLLSYLAITNLVWTVALNLTIPFLLVLLTANEYDKMSHWKYTLTFGYMEAFYKGYAHGELTPSLLAIALIAACLSLMHVTFIVSHVKRRTFSDRIPKALQSAAQVCLSPDMDKRKEAVQFLDRTLYELDLSVSYMERYSGEDRKSRCFGRTSANNKLIPINCKFILAITTLRDLLSHMAQTDVDTTKNDGMQDIYQSLENLLLMTSCCFFTQPQKAAQALLDYLKNTDWKNAENSHVQTCNQIKYILETLGSAMQAAADCKVQRTLRPQSYFRMMRQSISFDDYRVRYAIRLTTAFTVAFVLMQIIPSAKSYWIALNTMFMMIPVYDDVKHRISKRTLGTFIGVAAGFTYYHLVNIPQLTSPIEILGYAISQVIPWYPLRCACCAMAATLLATPVVGGDFAFVLRLIFFGVGALIVWLVNRFLFTTSNARELQRHFNNLLSLNRELIRLLLTENARPFQLRTLLIRSNLVFASVTEYAKQAKTAEGLGALREFIDINRAWQYAILQKSFPEEGLRQLDHLLNVQKLSSQKRYQDCAFLKQASSCMEGFFDKSYVGISPAVSESGLS